MNGKVFGGFTDCLLTHSSENPAVDRSGDARYTAHKTQMHHNIEITYPAFIIGHQTEYEGMSCCLMYHQRELAELYVEESGSQRSDIHLLDSPKSLLCALAGFQNAGVTHALWNATFHPSGCLAVPISDLAAAVREHQAEAEGRSGSEPKSHGNGED